VLAGIHRHQSSVAEVYQAAHEIAHRQQYISASHVAGGKRPRRAGATSA
jgi:hypothetical protein